MAVPRGSLPCNPCHRCDYCSVAIPATHHHTTTDAAIMRVATTPLNRTSVALTIVALCMLLLLAMLR